MKKDRPQPGIFQLLGASKPAERRTMPHVHPLPGFYHRMDVEECPVRVKYIGLKHLMIYFLN